MQIVLCGFVPMALCPVGIEWLTLQTDTLFMPAFEKGPEFLSILWSVDILLQSLWELSFMFMWTD